MKSKILLVDDEPDALEVLGFKLREAGFAPSFAADGAKALAAVRAAPPDLIVLDLMLPAVDGLEVCKILRRDPATAAIPILMLTAKAAEMDRVLGLELGADDYVTKPYSPRELVLRIKKLLTRTKASDDPLAQLRIGGLEIDVPRHQVTVDGAPVTLTATEFKLLEILARRRGRVQTRDRLLQDVWGYDNPIDSRTVDTHMRRLREKLGETASLLETIRGVGYRFTAEK
ncbi:response regulator [Opitutus terrae]|uniref:Phosphate regulon transcriptional regulatory protein PhoB n=1 Tax=Opitutus terrae (strain DSM 11246 / JCM 15787 / PB90-1) TaxID=452637 RepID=B1ZT43_OPITP|nr:response regulator transcription factor [Opitutus terrae]ACB75832.1 two component transcriptional regulator, winged helix family [Opitutus terrae PB90-1]